jgi:hypothetical protein
MKSAAHRQRMDERRAKQRARRPDREAFAYANVGRNHPDYGLHPHEHLKRKEAR